MNKKQISLILGTMCCLLTIGICVQIKTISNTALSFGKTQTENELRDSVSRWQQTYKNAYEKLEKKEKELATLREETASNSNNSTHLSTTLESYNSLLGYSELKGPGLIITLDDGENLFNSGMVTDYIVHDGDILQVVNALKNAGADAISVNGQRIVSNTSITCIGNVVKINNEKVGAPFVISAIGPTSLLYGSLTMPGGYISLMEDAGVKVKIEQVDKDSIIIPKYEGVYKFVYATRAE